ncbi:MAG: MerR family transcriptional regulator [Oscillospiraceae bacterium]
MMEKHRAIPQGFMTVGEVAKKLNTTVFTLQYYDNKDILKPSCKSEGGRRLYTHRDVVILHQILSMKYLGFSLEDIKTHLPSIEPPEDVATILSEQANSIRAKISSLTDVLDATEKLKAEVSQMKTVDWEKYSDILVLLQSKHEFYWAIKYLGDKFLDRAHSIDRQGQESIVNAQKRLLENAGVLQKKGVSPESEEAQALAKDYWDIVMVFTNGDKSLLSELFRFGDELVNPQKCIQK